MSKTQSYTVAMRGLQDMLDGVDSETLNEAIGFIGQQLETRDPRDVLKQIASESNRQSGMLVLISVCAVFMTELETRRNK
jgi:hypothetical protein